MSFSKNRIGIFLICSILIQAWFLVVGHAEPIVAVSENNILISTDDLYDGEKIMETVSEEEITANQVCVEHVNIVSENTTPAVRVLFVGNSFTKNGDKDENSIGTHLQSLAWQNNQNIEITTLAHGGAKLRYYAGFSKDRIDYYEELKTILLGKEFDYVVLQEQSLVPAYSLEEDMKPAIEKLKAMITYYQPVATILLYQTHGYAYEEESGVNLSPKRLQKKVAMGYHDISVSYGLEVVPAGMQFIRAMTLLPEKTLYDTDHKHPNANGYYVLAACFYNRFFGTSGCIDTAQLKGVTLTLEQMEQVSLLMQDAIVDNLGSVYLNYGQTEDWEITTKTGEVVSGLKYIARPQNVVEVDAQTGRIHAVGYGTAVIMATAPNGCEVFCKVIVPRPLQFSREYYQVGLGDKIRILPSGDAEQVVWKTSKKTIATVNADGIVSPKRPGVVRIKVTNQRSSKDTASYLLYISCKQVQNVKADMAKKQPEAGEAGAIQLTWDKVIGANSYRVYRSTTPNGVFKRIAKVSGTDYTDKKIKVNKTYYYKVQAICTKESKCDGIPSKVVSKQVLGIIELRSAEKTKSSLTLAWSKSQAARGYLVYRSAKQKGPYKKIGSLLGKTRVKFKDKSRKKNTTYYYKVVPYQKVKGKIVYGKPAYLHE